MALATSLSSFINAGLLFYILRRDGVYRPDEGWPQFLLQITAANLLMGGALWWASGDLTQMWLEATLEARLLRLSALVVGGLLVYALAIVVVGIRPRHLKI